MLNVFAIIGSAWDFYRKQPVLNSVLLWLILLPMTALMGLGYLQETHPYFSDANMQLIASGQGAASLLVMVIFLNMVLSIIVLWGIACVLLVAKKLVSTKAGRSRSSFRVVRKQASGYVANLFLTGILRSCFTFLWALLLIVPGIIYSIRTFFYHIVIVCEDEQYRTALNRSKVIVTGRTLQTLLYVIGLGLVIFILPFIGSGVLLVAAELFDKRLVLPAYVITSALWSFGTLIFTLSSVILYSELQKQSA